MAPIDYSCSPYRKTYTDECVRDVLLSWQARAVRDEYRRKCDAAGIIETTDGIDGLTAMLRFFPREIVVAAVAELLKAGVLEELPDGTGYIDPEHFEAQAKRERPNALVQAELRAKRRADARLQGLGRKSVRNPDSGASNPDATVTEPDTRSLQSREKQSKAEGEQSGAPAAPTPSRKPRGAGPGRKSKPTEQIEIPDTWVPTAAHRQHAERGIDVDASATRFRNHYAGLTFPGWAAINGRFSNWLAREKPINGKRTGNTVSPPAAYADGEVAI